MERKTAGIIVDEVTAQRFSEEALAEMMNSNDLNMNTHTILVEKDGQMIEIEVPIDDIDLLDDMDDEDLTEEGERSLGIIDSEHDTTSNETAQKQERKSMAVVDVVMDTKEGKLNIVCPYTGSSNVYHINSTTWASYETDEPFKVRIQTMDEEV
jgi:hypothetical protein